MTDRAKAKRKPQRATKSKASDPKPTLHVERGVRALRRHLKERLLDLRKVDFAGFKKWLSHQITYWNHNAVFSSRCAIRELRRANPRVGELEKRVELSSRVFQSSPSFTEFESLERQRYDTDRAVTGIELALGKSRGEKRISLKRKLDEFKKLQKNIDSQLKKLKLAHREKTTLERAEADLQAILQQTGIAAAEKKLQTLLKQQGRQSGKSGTSFEETSRQIVEQHIVGDFVRAGTSESARERTRILSRVTLGCARAEIDQMVVRLPRRMPGPVEVLAVVEAKRNINDLDIGFHHRQENLAWFTGRQDKYDASAYRTGRYTDGHFTGAATHSENGEEFTFVKKSFRHFRPDPVTSYFLDRLYFITTASWLHGMSSDEMSRLQHRVCTDVEFDLNNDEYLCRLWHWMRKLPSSFEGPDVFDVFTSKPKWGRNVFLVGK